MRKKRKEHQIHMAQTIKKIWNMINSVLIGLVILLAVALGGVRLVGLDLYVVLSGSMEPVYQTGSVIYVKDVDTSELDVGDAITYQLDEGTVVTHRIVEITEEGGETAYRTKGDANEIEDGQSVKSSQVIGIPVFTIPYLGYFVTYLQTTSGRYAAIAGGAVLLLMIFLPDMIFGSGKSVDKGQREEREIGQGK